MSKFKVVIQSVIVATVEVEAETCEEAIDLAIEKAPHDGPGFYIEDDWKVRGYNKGGVYFAGSSEWPLL